MLVIDVAVELVDAHCTGVVAFGIDLNARFGLEVDVAEVVLAAGVDVVVFEFGKGTVVDGDNKVAEE